MISARPFLLLVPTARLTSLGKTTRTCPQYLSSLIRPARRLCTPLLLAATTRKCPPALLPPNQLSVVNLTKHLLPLGHLPSLHVLELENNHMHDSVTEELYASLKTDLGRSLLSGSSVVHIFKKTCGDEWHADLKTAESLLEQLEPEVKSKMALHWYSIRHTAESKKLWIEQMCKHGYLSCEYWEKAVEAAMPFLSSNGILNIMKILKEEMFVSGEHTIQELQEALYKRTCRRIDINLKRMSGKLYPGEFGLLHDSKLNFLSYPSGNKKFEELSSAKIVFEQL